MENLSFGVKLNIMRCNVSRGFKNYLHKYDSTDEFRNCFNHKLFEDRNKYIGLNELNYVSKIEVSLQNRNTELYIRIRDMNIFQIDSIEFLQSFLDFFDSLRQYNDMDNINDLHNEIINLKRQFNQMKELLKENGFDMS